ncbi:hypothetical protein GCM10023160_25970 [Brachybacterium paraconglomeratum]
MSGGMGEDGDSGERGMGEGYRGAAGLRVPARFVRVSAHASEAVPEAANRRH